MIQRILALLLSLFAAAAFAAVDVNKANQADLESIKGIGPTIATKILDERRKGSFKDWPDMINRVKGIGEKNASTFSADGLTVNGVAYAGAAAASKTEKGTDAKKTKTADKSTESQAATTAKHPAKAASAASAPAKAASGPKK
jgi:competence protein ComEA